MFVLSCSKVAEAFGFHLSGLGQIQQNGLWMENLFERPWLMQVTFLGILIYASLPSSPQEVYPIFC